MIHGCDSHHTMGYSETEDANRATGERLRDEGRSQGRNTDRLNFAICFGFFLYCFVLVIVFCSRKFI